MKSVMFSAGVALMLTGCSFAPFIQSDSMDFAATIDSVSNQLLVTNILRARDHAPLHFANLSALRAQFQAQATAQAVLPFGAFSRTPAVTPSGTGTGTSATRASETNILGLQTAPSFDFSPLDTQEFTRGILTPIDPQVVKYYLDRDLPQALLLFLFIDRIVPGKPTFPIPDTSRKANVRPDPDQQELINDPEQPEKFAAFAKWVQGVFGPYPNSHVVVANTYLRQIGPAVEGTSAQGGSLSTEIKDFSSIDTSKVRVECVDRTPGMPDGKPCNENTIQYKIITYSEQPNVILCAKEQYFFAPLALFRPDMNDPAIAPSYQSNIDLWKQLCTSDVAPGTEATDVGTVYIRSVEGMIQYLGALISGPNAAKNQEALRQALNGYTLFNLTDDATNARFGVSYDGEQYYVHQYDSGKDRTVQTLALVNQLLNLNTKASELPSTRAVELVP
jgi:hypothetical protein